MRVDLTLRGIERSCMRLLPDREFNFEFSNPGLQFQISLDRRRGKV
jgi:hypothetical protein